MNQAFKSLNSHMLELAKYIVRKCIIDNLPISNLLLQKILFLY